MIAAMEAEHPDHVFFLGDHEKDGWALSGMYPQIPLNAVKGNCDFGTGLTDWLVEVEGVRFLLTHGHKYGAKAGTVRLMEAGMSMGADMVCFGHTHVAMDREYPGRPALFNPGTIGSPRGERRTYGVLYTQNGRIIKAEIKDTDTM